MVFVTKFERIIGKEKMIADYRKFFLLYLQYMVELLLRLPSETCNTFIILYKFILVEKKEANQS